MINEIVTVSARNTDARYLKSNQRPWVEYVTCDKTNQCPIYAQGKCVCFRYLLGKNLTCPNGTWHRKEGATKRSKSFWDFAKLVKEQYAPTAAEYKGKLCRVADYVYVPFNYLDGAANSFEPAINSSFIKAEDFNADMVEELLKFTARTWFGYDAVRGQKEEKEKFIQQLSEEMPDIYRAWQEKYPESASNYQELSPVGRTAYIATLPNGNIIQTKEGAYEKAGDSLVCNNFKNVFFGGAFGSNKPLKIVVKIEPDMTTKITDQMVVDNQTRYVD